MSHGTCRNPWHNISLGYPSFLQCCRFVVGKDDRIRFWEDPWVKEGILRDLFPRLTRLSCKQSMGFKFRRHLNKAECMEVARLVDILGGMHLNASISVCRSWEIDGSGMFSCKSYRSFLLSKDHREAFLLPQIWKANPLSCNSNNHIFFRLLPGAFFARGVWKA